MVILYFLQIFYRGGDCQTDSLCDLNHFIKFRCKSRVGMQPSNERLNEFTNTNLISSYRPGMAAILVMYRYWNYILTRNKL